MLQSKPAGGRPQGLHVAIIMDGNARWAEQKKRTRAQGYRAGAASMRKVVRAAPAAGIGTLTLFGLASQSLEMHTEESELGIQLARDFLLEDMDDLALRGVRFELLGRRDRIPSGPLETFEFAEKLTAGGGKLHLRLAIDYSARDAIVGAAKRFHVAQTVGGGREGFASLLTGRPGLERMPDVDLLIRCGGEQRLSDFLLWECAHAEIVFTKRLWPDFDSVALRRALIAHRSRERRYQSLRGRAG